MSTISDLAKAAAGRCWDGYEPVPGKDAYSDDSCRKIGSKKKKKGSEKKADDCHCYPGGPADPDKKGCKDPDCDHCGKATKKAFIMPPATPAPMMSPGYKPTPPRGGNLSMGRMAYNTKPPVKSPAPPVKSPAPAVKSPAPAGGQLPSWVKKQYQNPAKYKFIPSEYANSGRMVNKQTGVVEQSYDDPKALQQYLNNIMKKRGSDKEAFDVSSMANRAIQSPLGQGALNAGAGLYNKLPSQMRNRAGAYAMQAGGLNDQNVTKWKMPGFTPDPSQGAGIKSKTVAKTRQQGNQINESLNEKIRSMRPGHAGRPMNQLARGVMAGQMPSRTFPQGTPVANKVVVKNDQLKQDKIVPQAAYNRFTSGMGKGGSDIQALAKAAASAAWQRKAGKNSKGGLNEKGRKSYERENPGSDLKAPVTGKVKPGGKAAKRRKSFCARMKGNKGPMKKPNGEPTRKALSLRKWKC